MRRQQVLLAIFAVLVGACDGMLAVNGRVVDELGAPISGAKVSAYSAFPHNVSDDRGCFRLWKLTDWSKHRVPFLVEATGYESYLVMIQAPAFHQMVVHLPSESRAKPAFAEDVSSLPQCPGTHENAAQQGVEPDGRSPAAPARRLTP